MSSFIVRHQRAKVRWCPSLFLQPAHWKGYKMVSRSARCEMCLEIVDENCYKIEEDYSVYCHNPDWVIPGGTCWEKRVVEDFPEMEPWLWYGFDCDGCIPDENGECQCTSDGWKGY